MFHLDATPITDEHERIYYLSPKVILANTPGRPVEATRLRYVFRPRHVQRLVQRHGQIRLHHFGVYVDRGVRLSADSNGADKVKRMKVLDRGHILPGPIPMRLLLPHLDE